MADLEKLAKYHAEGYEHHKFHLMGIAEISDVLYNGLADGSWTKQQLLEGLSEINGKAMTCLRWPETHGVTQEPVK